MPVLDKEVLDRFVLQYPHFTIRLLNKGLPPSDATVYLTLLHRSDEPAWRVTEYRYSTVPVVRHSSSDRESAAEATLGTVDDFLAKGFKLAGLTSTYEVPELYSRPSRRPKRRLKVH